MLEYWWMLPVLLSTLLVALLIRRLNTETSQKLLLATICATILVLPAAHLPFAYAVAAITVVNLLILFRRSGKVGASPRQMNP